MVRCCVLSFGSSSGESAKRKGLWNVDQPNAGLFRPDIRLHPKEAEMPLRGHELRTREQFLLRAEVIWRCSLMTDSVLESAIATTYHHPLPTVRRETPRRRTSTRRP